MKAKIIFVAGGLATRMRPITEEIPKCLIDVNGTPLVQQQLEFFRDRGFSEFIFCVAHLADKVRTHFGDGSKFGVRCHYVEEPDELLGTAGSVRLAAPFFGPNESAIVCYGDNLTTLDTDSLLSFHREKKSTFTVVLRPRQLGYRSSSLVLLDAESRLSIFSENPTPQQFEESQTKQGYINNGIYVFQAELLQRIPVRQKFDFAKELIPQLVQEQCAYGYVSKEFFVELGRIEKYEAFLERFRGRTRVLKPQPAIFLDRDGVINTSVKDLIHCEQFQLLDAERVPRALKLINESGYLAILASNQPVLAKGFCTMKEMDAIHQKMSDLLGTAGGSLDALYVCPHHPERGFAGEVAELKIDCPCRKPKPGLLLNAYRDFNIDLKRSWMIGDSVVDVAAGRAAGVKTVMLTGPGQTKGPLATNPNERADLYCADLLEAVEAISRSHSGRVLS